ncbi:MULTISPECIES: hypothetical protein [Hyphomicrobiales]|jgi:hypothetical protein|uniref:hypothetical protein n=1 Tax=Methylobacterium sp. CCH7-A2 TaxID=1768789 RepID=UPI00082B38E5|nr:MULTISPECIES: hypothetical protein [Hyphomicrobiales]
MVALTYPRNTLERGRQLIVAPVAANTVIYHGALAALNAAGFAVPGSTSTTLKAAGRAQNTANNATGSAGAVKIEIKRGVFRFVNLPTDPILQADVLSDCYIVDDQTVAKTNGGNTRSKAGRVLEIEGNGVWVEIV